MFRHARHHLRGLIAAVAVLVLTAGVALAARPATIPAAAADGLATAGAAAGKVVPVVVEATDAAPTVDEAVDEDATEEPADAPADAPDNHGALVSAAAGGPTPEGFDNHGQYVKSVATANHGQETAKAAHEAAATRGAAKAAEKKPVR